MFLAAPLRSQITGVSDYTGLTGPNRQFTVSLSYVTHVVNKFSFFSRVESFCKGIVFSHRPVRVNEKVYIRFVEKSESWSGSIRFGFSTTDPRSLAGNLPKYACPDLTNKPGFWAKALAEKFADRDSVMYYYVTSGGDVVFGVNGEEKGVFFSGVDTRRQLWAMVDVYGNSNVIELVDPRRTLNNVINTSVNSVNSNISQVSRYSPEPDTLPPPSSRGLSRSSSCGRLSSSSVSKYYGAKRLAKATFHRGCTGQNVTLSPAGDVASRSDTEFCNGYVFADSPLQPGESLVVRVLDTETTYIGSLAFGLTGADPRSLHPSQLPEDSDQLLARPEYWVVSKDVLASPHPGDELCFTLSLDGAVLCSVNNGPDRVLAHVDISIPTWPFLDIYGMAQRVQLVGVSPAPFAPRTPGPSRSSQPQQPPAAGSSSTLRRSTRSTSRPSPRPKSCSPQSLPNNIYGEVGQAAMNGMNGDMMASECVICYGQDVDCVLYSCGHMCMCFSCAVQQWSGKGECPLCRATIRDVIRTYRA